MARKRVIVVGAGIVGSCIAEDLQRRGHDVTVVERSGIGDGCSYGNAGLISISGCVPQARMSTIYSLPKYLLGDTRPVSIKPMHFLKSLSWFQRFLRSAAPHTVEKLADVLALLLRESQPALFEIARRSGCEDLLQRSGTMYVFETRAAYADAQDSFRLRKAHGVALEELSGSELRKLEPALAPIFECAVRVPDNAYCRDPHLLVQKIFDEFLRHQGRLVQGNVSRVEVSASGASVHLGDQRKLEADTVVVAAGVWTKDLLRPFGVNLLLEAHRGYHVMTNDESRLLNHPLLWEERGFGITPMRKGLRAAGTVEIASPNAPANPRRAEQIRNLLTIAIPSANVAEASTWMGARPATPDTVPIVGALPSHPNVLAATGHGHLGLSMAAVTARIIGELVTHGRSTLDVAALRPGRFST